MADEPEAEEMEIGFEQDSPELCIADGDFWLADSVSFCEKYNIDGFLSVDGNVFALIDAKGWVNVEDLVKGKRGAAVRAIGGAK